MREIRNLCTESHNHLPTYPDRALKNGFTPQHINQIFIRTAPFISQITGEADYIGIPLPTKESVNHHSLRLTKIHLDGHLEFVIVATGEHLHLYREFNDSKWMLADSFLMHIRDSDIVCATHPEFVSDWSDLSSSIEMLPI